MTEWHMMDNDINGNRKVFNEDPEAQDVSVGLHRKVKRIVPDNEKDARYWEKRKRNNIAAKRSRENKRVVEMSIRHKMAMLEEENNLLKTEMSTIKAKFGISPDSVFLTNEDREKCRVKHLISDNISRDGPMDSQPSRDEESSSPGSSVSACTSPRNIAKTEFNGNPGGYIREEAFDRSSPDSSLHFHKKTIPQGKHQQRIPGAFPFPQTLFYGSSYGAQLMWASARCPGPVGGMQQLYQEYALNNGTVSPPNTNNSTVMPRSQYPHYAPSQISANTRPQDYFVYRSPAPEYPAEFDELGGPTDLSAPREKYTGHSQTVKREDPTEVRHTYHQTAQSRVDQPQVSANTLPAAKRRYSQEYSDNQEHTSIAVQDIRAAGTGHQTSQSRVEQPQISVNTLQTAKRRYSHEYSDNQGHTGVAVQDIRDAGTGQQTSQVSHNYSTPNPWTEQRSPVGASQTDAYNTQQRPNDGYYEHGSGYQQQSARLEAPYQQQPAQPGEDNEQLRKENEDLKVGLRQLFSQVCKMKDIVLPN